MKPTTPKNAFLYPDDPEAAFPKVGDMGRWRKGKVLFFVRSLWLSLWTSGVKPCLIVVTLSLAIAESNTTPPSLLP